MPIPLSMICAVVAIVLFDTDILIWFQRGHAGAADILDETAQRFISIYTYMELQQSAPNRRNLRAMSVLIRDFGFTVLPLTPEIGHRASIYIEEYTLAHGVRAGDALIAATAVEHGLPLSTSNVKHFRPIRDLDLVPFKP